MIELAVDNTVATLPVINLNDIPAMLRRIADQFESGEFGAVNAATLVFDCDASGIDSAHWGGSDSVYERLGMLDVAKHDIMRAIFGDD